MLFASQIYRRIALLEHQLLGHRAGQIDDAIVYVAIVEILVARVEFGQSFLQQANKQLVLVLGIVMKHEPILVIDRQSIVHAYVEKFAKFPQTKMKYARIVFVECFQLIDGKYVLEQY